MLYCHYSKLDSHILTCSTPGGRDTQSCQTKYNETIALQLIEKANRIIFSDEVPPRIHNNQSFYLCKWCEFSEICHNKAKPQLNCRTCLHSTAERVGGWRCAKLNEPIGDIMICGGEKHLYLPDMLGSKAVESSGDSVAYADGRINYEGGRVE